MDFEVFWCKIKLRVCLFCSVCFQHTFVETKATKTFSEVKSCVFSLSKFQKCRQKKVISWWKYLKNQRIMRHNRDRPPGKSKVTQDLVPHQFSSQTEHYLMSSPGARYSASWTRNGSAYFWERRKKLFTSFLNAQNVFPVAVLLELVLRSVLNHQGIPISFILQILAKKNTDFPHRYDVRRMHS